MALTTVPASLSATALTLTTAAQPNITSVGTLTGLTVSGNIAGTLTTAAQTNITSLGTLTALTIDDITIDGSTISDAGEFTLDIGADIILDSDNGVWRFKDAGTSLLQIARDGSSSVHFYSAVSNMNMLFKGNDGGNTITALDLDMENGGRADFANDISVNDGRGLRLGSDDDSIIYNDGSNLYVKNNTSNQDIIFQGNDDGSASLEMLKLDSSNLGAATFSGSVTANAGVNVDTTVIDSYIIRQNTSDGSDNSQLSLTGGGADSDGRGARARLYGNEHSSKGGDVDISTGNIANAQMDLYATGNFSVDAGGQIILDADTQGSGNGILLKDAGTHYGSIFRSSSHLHIKAEAQDKNLLFLTNNGGSELTALTLASDGTATFSGSVTTTNVTANNASEGDTYFTGGTANSRLLSIFTSTNDGGANAGHNFKIASGQGAFIFGNATTANLLKVQTGGIAVSGIATFSGKVGIGRTPAFAQLEIQADKTLANNLHIQMNGASNTNKQMIMGFDTTTDESHIISQIAGSALKPLIITADKVAIGGTSTLNPVAKLHVETSTNTPLYLKSSASAGGYVQYGLGPSGANLGYMGSGSQLASGGSSSDLSIRAQANLTFATGGATERMKIASDGRVHVGTQGEQVGATGKRGIRVGRTIYNWFNYGKNEGHTYLHIKTDLQFPTSSNPQPTMSMLHIKGYTYSAESFDSMLGFHNWSGTVHNPVYTNNGTRTVVSSSWAPYRSSDNYVVIVLSIGNNYPGISIDWHQAFDPYTWRDISVLAFTKNANTSGVY